MEKLYHAGMEFLRTVLDFLFPPRNTEQLVRSARPEDMRALVSPTLIPSLPYPTTALLPYREPLVQALIVELKFHKNKKAVALLSEVLREYLEEYISDASEYERKAYILVPIPLSKTRMKERGYNQVSLLCEAASASGICTVNSEILTRTRDTAPQTSLSQKERLKNMQGAFSANIPDSAATYIIVDDVSTTGATMHAAIAACISSGARTITPLALAH